MKAGQLFKLVKRDGTSVLTRVRYSNGKACGNCFCYKDGGHLCSASRAYNGTCPGVGGERAFWFEKIQMPYIEHTKQPAFQRERALAKSNIPVGWRSITHLMRARSRVDDMVWNNPAKKFVLLEEIHRHPNAFHNVGQFVSTCFCVIRRRK